MTSDELSALRALIREEINAAAYASEVRLGERLARVEFVQKQMVVNLAQVGSVLDEATIKINDLQKSQIALETKVEENTASIKRDIQKLNYSVRSFMDNMVDAVSGITMRFSMHKDTPINDAHPPAPA
jgi:hypothetical protein